MSHMIFFCYLHYALFFLVISEIHMLFGLKMNGVMYVPQTVQPHTQFFEIKNISLN